MNFGLLNSTNGYMETTVFIKWYTTMSLNNYKIGKLGLLSILGAGACLCIILLTGLYKKAVQLWDCICEMDYRNKSGDQSTNGFSTDYPELKIY
jgi:hypothetical protein